MRHVCMMESVKDHMVGCRELFPDSAAIASAAGATIFVGAPKHGSGPGGSARLMAVI